MVILGEIKHYSVAYFNCVTEFKALLSTSVELPLGGVHTHCIDVSGIHAVRMSPTLNVSSALQHSKHGNIYTLLHELACNNRNMHANECNKVFIIHYHNSVVSLLTQSPE